MTAHRHPCPMPGCPGAECNGRHLEGCGDGQRTEGCPFYTTPCPSIQRLDPNPLPVTAPKTLTYDGQRYELAEARPAEDGSREFIYRPSSPDDPCPSVPPNGAQGRECEREAGHELPHACVCGAQWTDDQMLWRDKRPLDSPEDPR